MGLLSVTLNQLTLWGRHGVYPEEKVWGNQFILDITVTWEVQDKLTDINQTLDYTLLAELAVRIFQEPKDLLEEVVQAMGEAIQKLNHPIRFIKINLQKLNPPLGEIQLKSSSVCWEISL